MSFDFLRLTKPVGNGIDNSRRDILSVKNALKGFGLYETPTYGMDGYIDREMDDALRHFQKKTGLREDGLMNPGGPTKKAMNRLLSASGDTTRRGLVARQDRRRLPRNIFTTVAEPDDETAVLQRAGLEYVPDPLGRVNFGHWLDNKGRKVGKDERSRLLGAEAVKTKFESAETANTPDPAKRRQQLRNALMAVAKKKLAESQKNSPSPRTSRNKPRKEPRDAPIKWKELPDYSLSEGRRTLKTKGPIRVDAISNTLGPDGIDYNVDWHPLDAKGNVIPEWRKPNDRPKREGGLIPPGLFAPGKKPDTFKPPYDNPHGWEVRISIPPQSTYHGNSAGPYLNIHTPQGTARGNRKKGRGK